MKTTLAKVFASLFLVQATFAEFNFTTCPASHEIQQPKVSESFTMEKLVGTYYELALHDYTQYPTCPKLSCIRSQKEFTDVGDGKQQIKDTFTLGCFGHSYINSYYFNTTETTGSLIGFLVDPPAWWKILFEMEYPDTIVDFKESADGGQYDWVIEFQCREKNPIIGGEKVSFTGFNFYSRVQNPDDSVLEEMLQSARDMGLGVYLDSHWGVTKVSQENCNYDAEDSTPWMPLTN